VTAFSDFSPFIIPFVRDCSDPAAQIAARFAIIDFCARTNWLQVELEPIDVQAGVADYDVETLEDTVPVIVITAALEGLNLTSKTQEELTHMYGSTDWRTAEGTPRYFTQIGRDMVRLVPSPDQDVSDGLKLLVSVQPAMDAIQVDDEIYQRHAECIGYGARARLKEMVGQPYYDPAGATACWAKFYAMCSEAGRQRRKDATNAVQHVQMRRF